MTKTLDYYLSLPYTIEIIPDDGAWFVQIKELLGRLMSGKKFAPQLMMQSDSGLNLHWNVDVKSRNRLV